MMLLLSSTCLAQFDENDFAVHGQVKTVNVNKVNLKDAIENNTEKRSYDKTGKMIRKTSGSRVEQFFYKGVKEPVLTANYEVKTPTQRSWYLNQFDARGKLLLFAYFERNGTIDGMDTYKEQAGLTTHNQFTTNSEIYCNKKTNRVSLKDMTFSNEMVPFIWDREVSEGAYESAVAYYNPDEVNKVEHTITYTLYEKGNHNNWLKIEYNSEGKGYWYRYLNNKLYQERFISNKKYLSDFGHLYNYDKQGKPVSYMYGYYAKMPTVCMQRKEYTYDSYGNITKETEYGESGKSYDVHYSYEYDKHNNWTVKISKWEDGSGSRKTRKLEYYTANEASLTNDLSEADYTAKLTKALAQAEIAEQKYKAFLSPKPKAAVASVTTGWKQFLPEGQVLDKVSFGDLNKDSLEDVVIVFQPKKALQHQRNTTRELRILFKQPDGKYSLAAQSKGAVIAENDFNVFFSGTQIKNGVLIVDHDFLRGGCTHKYRYQNGGFYLIGARKNTGDPNYSESFDFNLSTGKYVYDYVNDEDDSKSKKKTGVHKFNPLPNIETFEPFAMDVDDIHF